jgi:hypothetical protein
MEGNVRLIRWLAGSVLVGLLISVLAPDVRCCLTLSACDSCVLVERLPPRWRAKPVLAVNNCPHLTLQIMVRYQDDGGEWRNSPWQQVAPHSSAFLASVRGTRLTSHGGSYFYKAYFTPQGAAGGNPPASATMNPVNVYNQLNAWWADQTKITLGCEG